MSENTKPSAAYWGGVAGGNLAGGAAYLAAIRKIRMKGKLGTAVRIGSALIGDQVGSAAGQAAGSAAGRAVDKATGNKIVGQPKENSVQGLERDGGETGGFIAGAAAGAKHGGILGGAVGGMAGAVGGNYISGKLAHALSNYHPKIAARIHRGAMT